LFLAIVVAKSVIREREERRSNEKHDARERKEKKKSTKKKKREKNLSERERERNREEQRVRRIKKHGPVLKVTFSSRIYREEERGEGKRKERATRTGRVGVVFFFVRRARAFDFWDLLPIFIRSVLRGKREWKDERRGGAALDGDAGDGR
jgi:hypothetical protein